MGEREKVKNTGPKSHWMSRGLKYALGVAVTAYITTLVEDGFKANDDDDKLRLELRDIEAEQRDLLRQISSSLVEDRNSALSQFQESLGLGMSGFTNEPIADTGVSSIAPFLGLDDVSGVASPVIDFRESEEAEVSTPAIDVSISSVDVSKLNIDSTPLEAYRKAYLIGNQLYKGSFSIEGWSEAKVPLSSVLSVEWDYKTGSTKKGPLDSLYMNKMNTGFALKATIVFDADWAVENNVENPISLNEKVVIP